MLYDRDERKKTVSATCDGLHTFRQLGTSYGLPRVRATNSSQNRLKTTSKEHLPPTSRTSAELLDVNLRLFGGTDDTVRRLNFQLVFCFPAASSC